jgi:hypothetical protein
LVILEQAIHYEACIYIQIIIEKAARRIKDRRTARQFVEERRIRAAGAFFVADSLD